MRERVWILSCGNADRIADAEFSAGALVVSELCRVCLEDPACFDLAADETVRIVCHRPRAVRALLESCGRWPGEARVRWETPEAAPEAGRVTQPWYPVIDRQRCSGCGQCHAFCLFGVYQRDQDGYVSVAQPLNCKENCPACARICPEVAVIFPLLGESPISGDEVTDEAMARSQAARRQEELMDSDPYRMLKARREAQKRRLVDPEKLARALAEREHCRKEQGE